MAGVAGLASRRVRTPLAESMLKAETLGRAKKALLLPPFNTYRNPALQASEIGFTPALKGEPGTAAGAPSGALMAYAEISPSPPTVGPKLATYRKLPATVMARGPRPAEKS